MTATARSACFLPASPVATASPCRSSCASKTAGYGYATTDLAAIKHRTGTLGATRLLYVVGAPQAQHLAMVFATARLAGWLVAAGGGASTSRSARSWGRTARC